MAGFYQSFKLEYGFEEQGTGGKIYPAKQNKRLFEEVVLTSPYDYNMNKLYLNKVVSDSTRRQDGTFTAKMDKAIKDGADPTIGLKAAARAGQSPEVIQELMNRGADPATKRDISTFSNHIYGEHFHGTIPAIQLAAAYGHMHGVRVMWDHMRKDPAKYPEFDTNRIASMASVAFEGPTALYVVRRAKAELPPEEFDKVLASAMSGARFGAKGDILEELQQKYPEGGVQGAGSFRGYGLNTPYNQTKAERDVLTKTFISDLNRQKNMSPDALQAALSGAINMGSADAVRAAIARGADPAADDAHLLKGMLFHENASIDAFKAAIQPFVTRGTVKDKKMLIDVKEKFDEDLKTLPIEGANGEQRKKILLYMSDVMESIGAEGFTTTTSKFPGLTEHEKNKMHRMKGLPAITQLDSVPQIYDQLMDRLKVATAEPKASVSAGALPKPELGFATPAFG